MPETLGQRLKLARQDHHRLSIEQAAEATRIRPHYLQALEADDYSVIPSAPQARGFLRNYAEFLGLDLQAMLDELQAAQPADTVSGPLPQVDLAPPAPEAAANPPAAEESSRPPFWRAWLAGRSRQPEPSPEPGPIPVPVPEVIPVIAVEPQPEPPSAVAEEPPAAILEPPSKPRGRKKKVEAAPEPIPAVPEPPTRKRRSAASKVEDVPAVQEPVTRVRRKKKVEAEPPAPKADSAPEPPSPAPDPEPVAEPAAEAPIAPVVEEPAEVQVVGAEPSLLAKVGAAVKSIFTLRLDRKPREKTGEKEAEQPTPATEMPLEPVSAVPEPSQPESDELSDEIFREIGAQLRKRRELLSLTLEEIERHTRVRMVFAKALEEGNFEQLPSTVQTRGMLTSYATFLDLDTDALLLRYADALQAGHRARYPARNGERPPAVRSTLPPVRSFMAGDLFFGLTIVAMIVGLAGWALIRVFAQQAEQVSLPPVPSISEALAGTPLPTLAQEVTLIPAVDTPFALAETPTPEGVTPEIPTLNLNVNVFLNIVVTERTFMRVLVDGQEVFNGRVVPGAAYPYEAAQSVQVLTGNGAALRVTYNGRDMGLLGNFGEVVDYIYTADGFITPTPPAPPTGTATPKESPTPLPTPSPTRTPAPTPTSTSTPQS